MTALISKQVSWRSRFMHRHELVIRQQTKRTQKLPRDLDRDITQCETFVINQNLKENKMAHIGNMDETPMFFDVVGDTTISKKGEKITLVKTIGYKKQNFTVVLAASSMERNCHI